jgi:GT2 family glycosyltransferase
MKILIITVNYNNAELTINLSENIQKIFPDYDFYIVDNNSDEYNKSILNTIKYGTVIFNDENIGYFQGINIVLKKIDLTSYDYVIICNNDIFFDETFYAVISNTAYQKNIYAVSPRILDMDGVDQNPSIEHKVSKFKMFFYDIYFINFYFGQILYTVWQILKKIKKSKKDKISSKQIYTGYGAVYILTKYFFEKNKTLDHPPFLMGEEAFLAYQIFNTGGILFYNKDLIVYHKDHSSCSKIPSKQMYLITKESYKRYRDIFLTLPYVK